jgi:hypothetical protein
MQENWKVIIEALKVEICVYSQTGLLPEIQPLVHNHFDRLFCKFNAILRRAVLSIHDRKFVRNENDMSIIM